MAKQINTRIQLKRDSLTNWNESSLILKPGELGIAYVDVATKDAKGNIVHVPTALLKVGENVDNSTKTFKELPFISAIAADVYAWAKKEGIEIIDEGTGECISDVAWDATKNALVLSRTDVVTPSELSTALANYYTKGEIDGKVTTINDEIAKKVAKTDYEADKATFATKTELGNVDAKFASYNTTVAQKAIDDAQDAEIAKKVDKIDGYSLVADTEIERLANVDNYDDSEITETVSGQSSDIEKIVEFLGGWTEDESGNKSLVVEDMALSTDLVTAVENIDRLVFEMRDEIGWDDYDKEDPGYYEGADITSALHAVQEQVYGPGGAVDAIRMFIASGDIESSRNFGDAADLATAVENNVARIAEIQELLGEDDRMLGTVTQAVAELQEGIGLKADASYVGELPSDTEATTVVDYIDAKTANIASDERVSGLEDRIGDIEADYLTSTDKTALQEQITANANAITVLTDGIDPNKIDGLTDLVNWANEHAPEVASIKEDIEALDDRVTTAEGNATAAVTTAGEAKTTAEGAATVAGEAKTLAQEAKDAATNATTGAAASAEAAAASALAAKGSEDAAKGYAEAAATDADDAEVARAAAVVLYQLI